MSQPVLQYAPPTTPSRDNLARRTAHGFLWLMAQTIGSKLVGMAGQVFLAWLIMPADNGLWGAAAIVISFTGLIQAAGIRETLIHRQRTFHLWANSAFWMTVGLGVLAGGLTALAAWPASLAFHEPRLFPMLLILAATAPLMSLDQVAEAGLQNQLRFGLLASVNWGIAICQQALFVFFAWLLPAGYKAYAFVIPRPFLAIVRLILLWNASRPPVRMRLNFGRWRYLISDSATLLTSNFFLMLQWQGDYLILGLLFPDKAVLGIYLFAYNLSTQAMQLFTGNLTNVLFPALSKLQGDPKRQIRAFLDATRLLALLAVPLCFIQMATADPGVRLFFQDGKWAAAIPVLQALSVGMAFRVVASPGGSLIQAQGRFKVILITNIINAIVFLTLVAIGAILGRTDAESSVWLAPPTTVGFAVALYFALIGPIFLYIAIRPNGGTWSDIAHVYGAPMVASIASVAIAMAIGHVVPIEKIRGHRWAQAVRLMVVLVWCIVLYIPLIKLLAPDAWKSLLTRIGMLYRGRATPEETPAVA